MTLGVGSATGHRGGAMTVGVGSATGHREEYMSFSTPMANPRCPPNEHLLTVCIKISKKLSVYADLPGERKCVERYRSTFVRRSSCEGKSLKNLVLMLNSIISTVVSALLTGL